MNKLYKIAYEIHDGVSKSPQIYDYVYAPSKVEVSRKVRNYYNNNYDIIAIIKCVEEVDKSKTF